MGRASQLLILPINHCTRPCLAAVRETIPTLAGSLERRDHPLTRSRPRSPKRREKTAPTEAINKVDGSGTVLVTTVTEPFVEVNAIALSESAVSRLTEIVRSPPA